MVASRKSLAELTALFRLSSTLCSLSLLIPAKDEPGYRKA
jgi:hypothetical protein